jgi:hypothetical protein
VLELGEQIKSDPGSVGLLVTPYAIEREGVVGLEGVHLVDGERLRELVEEYLPHRRAELARYRLASAPLLAARAEAAPSTEPLPVDHREASHARP